MNLTPLQVVVDALERHGNRVKRTGADQVDATCPAHDDQTPSLSVRYDRTAGKVLVNCHTGCSSDEVIAALGLTWAELFDPKPEQDRARRPEVVATYDYADEHGVVQFQKLRYFPKTFKIRRPDGRGGWTLGIGDAPRVLYRLPELRAAVTASKPVLVVEGEKDADRVAEQLGLAATCNYEGAAKDGQRAKWRREYSEQLRGAMVLVVADHDDAGHAHARAVAAALQGVAAAVRVFRPAVDEPKADMTDHLDAGLGLGDLVPLAPMTPEEQFLMGSDRATLPTIQMGGATTAAETDSGGAETAGGDRPRRLRITRASEVVSRRLRWLWDLRIVLGGLTLIARREGLGKSTIAVWLAALVTRGQLDGELKGEPRTVIYVNSEDARDYTIKPRLEAAGADLDRVVFVDAVMPGEGGEEFTESIVLPRDAHLLAELARGEKAALVILDAATSVIDSKLDGDKDRQMRQGLESIGRVVGEGSNAAVTGIVHFGKRDSTDTGKLILGSIAWSQVARSVLAVARNEEDDSLVLTRSKGNLTRSKGNLGVEPPSLALRIVEATVGTSEGPTAVGRVELIGETEQDARDLLGAVQPDAEERTALDEAADWLHDYLIQHSNPPSKQVKEDGRKARHHERTIERSLRTLGVTVSSAGFPRQSFWQLPDGHSPASCARCASGDSRAREVGATGATEPDQGKHSGATGATAQSRQAHVHDATGGGTGATEAECTRCKRAPAIPADPLGRCRTCAYPTEQEGTA